MRTAEEKACGPGMGPHAGVAPLMEERNVRALYCAPLLALLALAGPARATGCCQPRCVVPPCPEVPDCPCPCEGRCHLTLFGPEHAQKYIDVLKDCNTDCCERIKAAKKLGCRLHADFCEDPCVLEVLIDVLLFDPCWEVRYYAAWAIWGQRANTHQALLALYIASKMDPHYLVRVKAAEALDLLTLCRACCYKDLYEYADRLIKELRTRKYKAGEKDARANFGLALATVPPFPGPTAGATPGPFVTGPRLGIGDVRFPEPSRTPPTPPGGTPRTPRREENDTAPEALSPPATLPPASPAQPVPQPGLR
jgi:hypothetical protein